MSNDNVLVQISVDNVGVARSGYGMPMVVSHNADFADRLRTYSSRTAVLEDFDSGSPEDLAATAFFAQSPKPPLIAIGRASSLVTQRYEIDSGTPVNSHVYVIEVVGEGFDAADASYTSGASATQEQIHNGLVTALNAVTDKNYTAAFAALVYADDTFTAATTDICTNTAHGLLTGDGPFQLTNSGGALPAGLATATNYWIIKLDADTFKFASSLANALAGTAVDITGTGTGTHTISDTVSTVRPSDPFTVTASATGNWFSLALAREDIKNGSLTIVQNHALPSGLSTDLDNILEADTENAWYQVHTLYNSKAYVAAVAAWAETAERTYVFDTNETAVIKTAYVAETTTDVGTALFDLGYARTMGCYHRDPSEMLAMRWMGRWLPTSPGAATAKFKTLTGISPDGYTDTEKTNLKARRMNGYIRDFGRAITFDGTVFSTVYRYLDVVRDVDWLTDRMRTAIFGVLAGADKVPYTPGGLAMIQGAMLGSVDEAVRQDVLADGTTAVEMPVFDDIDDADKSDRVLRNAKFSGTLTGAIHAVIPVLGVVTF